MELLEDLVTKVCGFVCPPTTLKRKCLHFDEIFITGCTGSCQNDNFQCSQWLKFRQNDDIFVSVNSVTIWLTCDWDAPQSKNSFGLLCSSRRWLYNRCTFRYEQPRRKNINRMEMTLAEMRPREWRCDWKLRSGNGHHIQNQTSNISRTLIGNIIVDHSDEVEHHSTTSSFST